MQSPLFSPLTLREVTFRNRIFVSPMCQYSAEDGVPTQWHAVHLGSRAVGGAGLVTVEATAVSPEGRITPMDTGLWSQEQVEAFKPIVAFLSGNGAVPGIQLAHAGRKASTTPPWEGGKQVDKESGGWQPIAPTSERFAKDYPLPREMTLTDIERVTEEFRAAAKKSLEAGFKLIELHMAHGYLLHEFMSPLSNHRSDQYGGTFDNRVRFALEVAAAVREEWPAELPLLARLSVTDWTEGGWNLSDSIKLARKLKAIGVDMIDCSSGGNVAKAMIPTGPGYQTGFAATIRGDAKIPVAALGMIVDPVQADHVIRTAQADAVSLARAFLRDPYWPLTAARKLGIDIPWPKQYERARIEFP